MESVHGSIYPLIMLACVLGMKHGMDADHLHHRRSDAFQCRCRA